MIKKAYLAAVILSLICVSSLLSQPMNGRDVMQKQKDLHKSHTEFIEQEMILIDKSGREEVRALKNYVKEVEEDVNRTLIVFLSPADIKGTALLTWQHKDGDDDQWLYFPARGKMQRIAKGGKKNYFMGTDFTYEDMQSEELDDYTYTILRDEAIDGSSCYVIESVPANEKKQRESGYSKRIIWITKDHYTASKVEFYDRRDKLIKTQINREWVNVTGPIWRPQKMLMENHKARHKTKVSVIKRELNQKIDDQTFTQRFILKGRHVR